MVAWMTRMSRSSMRRMTGVPAWVRPMPMWWSVAVDAEGDVAGVSTRSWRTRCSVSGWSVPGVALGRVVVGDGGGGAVWE